MTVDYSAQGWEIETPYIPTRGEHKLPTGEGISLGMPIQYVSTDSNDNKLWVKKYDSALAVSGVLGVSLEARFPSGAIPAYLPTPAGMDWYTRDIGFMVHGGPVSMPYVTGAMHADGDRRTRVNDWVAPHPSGFQLWTANSGMVKLGRTMQSGRPTGMSCMVYIDIDNNTAY